MEQKTKKVENGQVDAKIDAIKNLLFGENIQEYAAEFERIQQQIEQQRAQQDAQLKNLKDETRQQIAAMQEQFTSQLAAMQKEFAQQLERLNAAKADRNTLGDMLIELGKHLKA